MKKKKDFFSGKFSKRKLAMLYIGYVILILISILHKSWISSCINHFVSEIDYCSVLLVDDLKFGLRSFKKAPRFITLPLIILGKIMYYQV